MPDRARTLTLLGEAYLLAGRPEDARVSSRSGRSPGRGDPRQQLAGAAEDDDARAAERDLALGRRATGPAAAASRLSHRHLAAEDVEGPRDHRPVVATRT
jgi:hypothetical protein